MSYLKDREIWLSSVPTGNPPAGYVWVFIQNGVFVVRDSNGVDKIMASTTGTVTNATSASYVEYSNVADKPALISGSSQVSYTGLSDIPAGIVSGSAQIVGYNVFATTGSNQFNGSQAVTGSLTVTGQVVAQTLNVQQVTSSIVYSSGSNIFGNDLGNTQQFTGSMSVTGSLAVNGAGTFASSVTATTATLSGSTSDRLIMTRTSVGTYHLAISTTNRFSIYDPAADAERISITSGGNVGIGVSPSSRLHVKGSGTDGLTLERSAASQDVFIKFQNENGVDVWQQLVTGTAQDFSLTRLGGSGNILLGSTGGNVGIGTASPNTKLQIEDGFISTYHNINANGAGYGVQFYTNGGGSKNTIAAIEISQDGTARSGNMIFSTSNAGAPSPRMTITPGGGINISGPYLSMDGAGLAGPPSGLGYGLYPHSGIGLGYYSVAVGHVWYVTASPVSRMYLTTDNLFLGPQQTTIYPERLNVAGGIRIHSGNEWDGVGITADGTRVYYNHTGAEDDIRFQFFGNTKFILYSNGNYEFSGSNVSDARLKNSISSVTTSYIDKINQLKLSTFKMNSETTGSFKMGFIAQHVKTILPEIVTGDETNPHEYLGVDTNGLLALAIKAIQELKSENDNLKSRLEVLEQS
jgi:hypothetical protein